MKLVSIVIPVFNNARSLEIVLSNIVRELNNFPELQREIIFVNDGSQDNSLEIIKTIKQTDPTVKHISFTKNYGQVPAIVAGLKHCKGDAAIIRSADLQDPFNMISDFIRGWQEGNPVVIGYRDQNKDSLDQRIPSRLFYKIMIRLNPQMPIGGYDHCLLDRKAIEGLGQFKDKHRFLQGDILSMGFPTKLIPYTREKNQITSKKRAVSKRIKYFIDGILNTTFIPIRLMSYVGLIFASIGIVYSIVIVIARFTNNVPFEGWAPIMIMLLIIGGLIMLMLGVIGEYLWRIYDEIKGRPEYIIEEMDLD